MNLRTIFDIPWVYAASQRLIPFTVWVYEDLIRRHAKAAGGGRVLDIGCGVGAHRHFFPGCDYWGVDINAGYIEKANRRYGSGFQVMDATRLDFSDGSFDRTLCVATFHHLSDAQAEAAIAESLRVVRSGGRVHIIDPVITADTRAWVKRWVFANDRGRHQRTPEHMRTLVGRIAPPEATELVHGRLHDVLYLRLTKA